MEKTVNYEKENEILESVSANIDTEKLAILTMAIEDFNIVAMIVGSCVLGEIREKIDLKALCRQLKEQANDDVTEWEAELMLFSDLMNSMRYYREKWFEKREKSLSYVSENIEKYSERVVEIFRNNDIFV